LKEKATLLPGGLFVFRKQIPVRDQKKKVKGVREKRLEPTIGLEPMTCRLRIDCSTN
jgi:hypothetical protein